MLRAVTLLTIGTLASATQADIIITEIMYDNAGGNEHEYIELYNTGAVAVDLTGYTIKDDPGQVTQNSFTIPSGSIAPGGTAVIARVDGTRTLANYQNAWGAGINWIVGTPWPVYTNAGDTVELYDPSNTLIASVAYSTSNGFPAPNDSASIYMLDINAANLYDGSNWALSQDGVAGAHFGNSPRASDVGSPGVIPEPASVALMTLGVFGLMRRK